MPKPNPCPVADNNSYSDLDRGHRSTPNFCLVRSVPHFESVLLWPVLSPLTHVQAVVLRRFSSKPPSISSPTQAHHFVSPYLLLQAASFSLVFFMQISQHGIRAEVLSSNLPSLIHPPFQLNIPRVGPHLLKKKLRPHVRVLEHS